MSELWKCKWCWSTDMPILCTNISSSYHVHEVEDVLLATTLLSYRVDSAALLCPKCYRSVYVALNTGPESVWDIMSSEWSIDKVEGGYVLTHTHK